MKDLWKLPEHFFIGGATAGYQSEGRIHKDGKSDTGWDVRFKNNKDLGYDGEAGAYFYDKFEEDLDLCVKYKMMHIRVSIQWSRIFPDLVTINEKGVSYYKKLFKACRERGIKTYVTLHHFDSPQIAIDKEEFFSEEVRNAFYLFSETCFKEFDDLVDKWITFNEIMSISYLEYILGSFNENNKYLIKKFIDNQIIMMVMHAKIMNHYNKNYGEKPIGIVHIFDNVYPYSNDAKDVHASKKYKAILYGICRDLTYKGELLEDTRKCIKEVLDANNEKMISISREDQEELLKAAKDVSFVGVNYYASRWIAHYEGETRLVHNGDARKGTSEFMLKGAGIMKIIPLVETTKWDWPIYPRGLYDMLVEIERLFERGFPTYITENGFGEVEQIDENGYVFDDYRIEYVRKHLGACTMAIREGVNLRGYFMWSLHDLLSWTNGYKKKYGAFYVDHDKNGRKTAKKSALWIRRVNERKDFSDVLSNKTYINHLSKEGE